ncbi:signal peptidase I [bacterium]|nr:signal peptidase I [bacterium]
MGIIALIYLAIVVLMIASLWIIFTKAGKPGWACLIPIYNIIVLLEIVGKPWWWLLLMLIPIVNIIVLIIVVHGLSVCFGKGAGFTAGLILLGFVFYPMLAFGDATYTAPAKSS